MPDNPSAGDRLEALAKTVEDFERRLTAKPLDATETKNELVALKKRLGLPEGGTKSQLDALEIETAAAAAARGVEAPAASKPSPPTYDANEVAGVLIATTHHAATTLEVLQAKGAEIVADAEGRPAIKTRDGETLPLREGLTKLCPQGLLKPVGARGSGGRGGVSVPTGRGATGGTILERYAESGYDHNFYTAHHDEIVRAKYGRLPLK